MHRCFTFDTQRLLSRACPTILQGKLLNAICKAVHSEFVAAAEKLSAVEYDVLDLSVPSYPADAAGFKFLLQELDRRLAAVIMQVQHTVNCPVYLVYLAKEKGRAHSSDINPATSYTVDPLL